jgi:hypothetical protein
MSDLKSMSVDEERPPGESSPAPAADDFQAQREKIQRLNDYCSRVTAELRASLGRPPDEGS